MGNDVFSQVNRCKARYWRFIDQKQWDRFADLFVANPCVRIYDPAGRLVASFGTKGEFVASARDFIGSADSMHQIHNAELDRLSASAVSAIWSMEDYFVFPRGRGQEPDSVHGCGHYYGVWTELGSGWLISSLELRPTIFETRKGGACT